MIINHNMNAMNAHRNMMGNIGQAGKSMEKLSSGLRINRAGDDAAGLAISEKMRGQIRGLDQASRNAQDGISMIQTAEGALNETQSILQRMRELATQAANDTNTSDDRKQIQNEVNQLTSEINRIGNTTEFNTQKVLDGGTASKTASTTDATATTGTEAAGASTTIATVDTSANLTGLATKKISINGEDVTLTNTGTLDGSTTAFTVDDLVTALQTDIDAVANLKDTLTVSKTDDGNGIKISTVATGESATLDITASADTQALGLTADATTNIATKGTDATEADTTDAATGFTATLQIGANKGQAFKISIADMRSEALGISKKAGASGETEEGGATEAAGASTTIATVDTSADLTSLATKKISINGEDVTLTNTGTLDGSTTAFTVDQLVTALQTDIDAVANLKDTLTVSKTDDGNGIKISTVATGESATLDITASADTQALGLTADATTDISTKGTDATEADTTDATGTFAKDAAVTNGTTEDTVESALDMSSHDTATASIEVLDKAINTVSTERSKLGAYQNRLEHTINNLGTSSENLTAAESRVRDVDMAKEMMSFSKKNILSQAAQAMLAQANQQPQGVLQLLR